MLMSHQGSSLGLSARASHQPVRPMSMTQSLRAVEQRLAHAERELRVQFTRIAQLQAELDQVLGALRRSAEGVQH